MRRASCGRGADVAVMREVTSSAVLGNGPPRTRFGLLCDLARAPTPNKSQLGPPHLAPGGRIRLPHGEDGEAAQPDCVVACMVAGVAAAVVSQ